MNHTGPRLRERVKCALLDLTAIGMFAYGVYFVASVFIRLWSQL